MRSPCPPEELLGQFLAEELSPTTENDLESHLRDCNGCRDRWECLTADSESTPVLSAQSHPPLSSHFAQRLEESLRSALDDSDCGWDSAFPEIPGYDLLESIGRGGSSIVFRARDQKLQRIVAIKVLRERASRVDRERFNREAKALAALRHPNITRAHGAGETNDRLYLVLEFIPGGSLGRFIAGEPQPPRSAARLVRQLAGAMQAAHAAGFVHRDLKPSNILLDAHFGQGESSGLDRFVPKVTDLGIVKDLSRDDGFTGTRDCLGTPSYMAPEQVRGSTQNVDCRTDVYALGTVLYELLTGRPPFRAGSPLDTMLQVKHDEPVPPSRFHPHLPRDLETICLKCLEKDPARRYQSARLLAEDLDRLLLGRPIVARRIRWPSKLWRWSGRNPGWAAAAIASLTTLLTLAIGGPLVAQREHELREQALRQEHQAQLEHTRALEQFELAHRALEGTLTQVLHSARLQETLLDDVRASLIRGAIPYYEKFLQSDDADPSVRERQGRMLLQLASVHDKEQRPDKARDAYRRALQMLESVSGESMTTDAKASLATAHMEYGRFLQITDTDPVAAERHYRLALGLRNEVLAKLPQDAGVRDNVAIATSLLGTLYKVLPGRTGEAQTYLEQTIAIRDQLVVDFPARDDLRHYAAFAHINLGMLHRQLKNTDGEIREFQIASELERQVNKSSSVWLESPHSLAEVEGQLGVAFARNGEREPAMRHMAAAVRTAEALELSYPGVRKYTELRQRWQEALEFLHKHETLPPLLDW
jgi:eukaryotic-like serine/threonine-protein kinase